MTRKDKTAKSNQIKAAKELLELIKNNKRQIDALEEDIKDTKYIMEELISGEEQTITRSIKFLRLILKFLQLLCENHNLTL